MESVIASIPRTVRVPVAKRLVKNRLWFESESKVGVMFSVFPKLPRNFALRLSTQIKITLGLSSGSESVFEIFR